MLSAFCWHVADDIRHTEPTKVLASGETLSPRFDGTSNLALLSINAELRETGIVLLSIAQPDAFLQRLHLTRRLYPNAKLAANYQLEEIAWQSPLLHPLPLVCLAASWTWSISDTSAKKITLTALGSVFRTFSQALMEELYEITSQSRRPPWSCSYGKKAHEESQTHWSILKHIFTHFTELELFKWWLEVLSEASEFFHKSLPSACSLPYVSSIHLMKKTKSVLPLATLFAGTDGWVVSEGIWQNLLSCHVQQPQSWKVSICPRCPAHGSSSGRFLVVLSGWVASLTWLKSSSIKNQNVKVENMARLIFSTGHVHPVPTSSPWNLEEATKPSKLSRFDLNLQLHHFSATPRQLPCFWFETLTLQVLSQPHTVLLAFSKLEQLSLPRTHARARTVKLHQLHADVFHPGPPTLDQGKHQWCPRHSNQACSTLERHRGLR